MSDEAYNKKLADLQQYVPFMENMITQLKDPKWKPREAQLNKMESLYTMITDKNKKWKFDTLLKCEEVILKLQTKIKKSLSNPSQQSDLAQQGGGKGVPTTVVNEIMNVLKLNTARAKLQRMQESNETPKSPSPTPEISIPCEPPKIIPIEPQESYKYRNIIDPNDFSSKWDNNLERYTKEKPDIYSSAAQSLTQTPKIKNKSIFERLGPVVTEPQKPLLTDDDLAQLGTDDLYLQSASNDLKQKDSLNIELNLKITPRIVPVPSSKPKISKNETKNREKTISKEKDVKIKTVKVDGNVSGDVFGSLLSSIDTKILEETKKKDHKKDSHYKHKDDKEYKHKDREKKDYKHHHSSRKVSGHKEKSIKEKSGETKTVEKSIEKSSESFDVRKDEKTQEDYVSSTVDIPMDSNKPRRLADKYHPKPRLKQPQEEVGSTSRIEEKEEVKLNRDPRRRSPPFSASYFNQNSSTATSGFDSMNKRDLNWGKYQSHVSTDGQHVQGVGRFDPRLHQGFNATNTGYTQDVVPSAQLGLLPTPQNPSHLRSPQHHTNHQHLQNPPQFQPPQHIQSSQHLQNAPQFQTPQHSRFDPRFDHYDHHHQRPRTPFNERPRSESSTPFFQPPPVQSPLLPTPNQPPQQFTPRKTFNPFEPLDAEKEKEREEDSFNKRDFNYGRFGSDRSRSKFERGRFDRRFESRRDRFGSKTPRRSLDEDEFKNVSVKSEKVEETFTSPLEALYSTPKPVLSASQAKAALDKFKIPKKKQDEKKVDEIKEKKDDESDEDEDTPLSRKIKRRLRIKIDDDSEESDEEKKKGVEEVKKCEDVETKIDEKVVVEEEKVETTTRRLRTRAPKIEVKKVEEEKKVSPQRRSQRVQKKNLKYACSKEVSQKESVSEESLSEISEKEIPENKLSQNNDSLKIDEKKEVLKEEKVEENEEISTVKVEEKPETTQNDETLPEKEKVKNELLADIKKNHLKMEETDVLQFILENYKKIKKILKSDSSSEDENESKKKKDIKKIETENVEESKDIPKEIIEKIEPIEDEKITEKDDDIELVDEYVYKNEESEKETKLKPKKIVKIPLKSKKNPVKKVIVKRKAINTRLGMNTRTGKHHQVVVKAKKARRSELDKLHDDIKEMLMGNEIMTVGGKRTCTITKDDEKEKQDDQDDEDEEEDVEVCNV
nr:uncharacterized protein LOC111421571 [Onthophagus taurus]XP_022910509.1 uncharacterized protein LOC111421571 [Onthophagus taurus]